MTAGARRNLIVIERASVVTDDFGQEIETWIELGIGEWAEIFYGRGDERRQAAMEQGLQPATFVVLDNETTRSVTVRDRISFEGIWDVAQNVLGKKRGERELTATRAQ